MFTRPPFAAVALSLASILVAILLLVTPSAEGFIAEIAPEYYARISLRDAKSFMGPNASDEVGFMQRPVVSWRTLASAPDAPRLFAELTERGSSAGKLFGLSGLMLADTLRARTVLSTLLQDSSRVSFISPCEFSVDTMVAALAAAVATPGWSLAMRDSIARCDRR